MGLLYIILSYVDMYMFIYANTYIYVYICMRVMGSPPLHNGMVWADTFKISGDLLGVSWLARNREAMICELALVRVSVAEGRATGLMPHRLRYNVVPEVVGVRADDSTST